MRRIFEWAWQRALDGRPAVLTRVFWRWIPFNRPHRFQIVALAPGRAQVSASLRRANRNHLGTLHACALATIGEFSAGLALLGAFSPSEYRLIMSRLEVDYTRRANTEVLAASTIESQDLVEIRQRLGDGEVVTRWMTSELKNTSNDVVATVRTQWQIKAWSATKS
jgi:acyl-coenzyme A thioesterase PaaI-like protein